MITAQQRNLTEGDTGELLGPDSEMFRHLRGFTGKVKGVLPERILLQLEDRHPGSTQEVLRHLLPPFRDVVESGVVPSEWYPEVFMCALLRAKFRVVPPGTLVQELELGRDVFVSVAKLYHRLFFRMAGPQRLLQMSKMTWGLYHSEGELRPEVVSGGARRMIFTGNPALLEPGYAEGAVGFIWGAMELAGAKDADLVLSLEPPSTMILGFSW